MSRELLKLMKLVTPLGFTIEQGSKHLKVLRPNGTLVMTIGKGGKSEWRAARNWVAEFRKRTGIDLRTK